MRNGVPCIYSVLASDFTRVTNIRNTVFIISFAHCTIALALGCDHLKRRNPVCIAGLSIEEVFQDFSES